MLQGPCTVPFQGRTWKDQAWSYSAEDHRLDLLFSGIAFDRCWMIIDDHKRKRKAELEGAFSYAWWTGLPSPLALTAMNGGSSACARAGLNHPDSVAACTYFTCLNEWHSILNHEELK